MPVWQMQRECRAGLLCVASPSFVSGSITEINIGHPCIRIILSLSSGADVVFMARSYRSLPDFAWLEDQ